MKRLEEIKNEYARNHGFDDWKDIWYDTVNFKQADERYNEVTELYAREVAQASLEKAAENVALFKEFSEFEFKHWIDKESITSETNITLL